MACVAAPDDSCNAYAECFNACDLTTACREQCASAHPAGRMPFQALLSCVATCPCTFGGEAGAAGQGGAVGVTCMGEPNRCVGTTHLWTCTDEVARERACSSICEEFGYTPGPCNDGKCLCASENDRECSQGLDVSCQCAAAWDSPCYPELRQYQFVACHQGRDPETRCLGQYYDPFGTVDCNSAAVCRQ